MNGSVCLHDESYDSLRQLRRKNIVSSKLYAKLEDCSHPSYLGSYFIQEYNLSPDKINLIWEKIRVDYCYWEYGNRRNSWFISECQHKFLDLLLRTGGAITRQEVKEKRALTDAQMNRHLDLLEEIEIIIVVRSTKRFESKITYVLHPNLLK